MTETPECRKFGSIAYAIGFAFMLAGVALFQLGLRDRVPPLMLGDGWFDWGKAIGSAVFGAFAGLIGGMLGYFVERAVRR